MILSPFVLVGAYLAKVRRRILMLHNTRQLFFLGKVSNWQHAVVWSLLGPIVVKLNEKLATDILGCSRATLDSNIPRWKDRKAAAVLYLGIDVDRFCRRAQALRLRRSLGFRPMRL